MEDDLTYWDSKPPETDATVEEIDHFDARGMRRVYGRGDHFGRHRSFNMDIWLDDIILLVLIIVLITQSDYDGIILPVLIFLFVAGIGLGF